MRSVNLILFTVLFLCVSFKPKGIPFSNFKFIHFSSLKGIPEPSDIVYDKGSDHFFIVSDHGILFETDLQGKIIRSAKKKGMDFEGVEVDDSFVYVSDETPRKVYKYKKQDLSLDKIFTVNFFGPLNKAYESLAYNYSKKCFILVSQQNPIIFEYDSDFKLLNKYSFPYAREISSARWYKDEMYLLSGKDECIFRCDPVTYKPIEKYNISVLNPEGLGFDKEGNVVITSDDLQRIYFFNILPKTI